MMRHLAEANAAGDAIRRDFGYIRVAEPDKLYIARIPQHQNNVEP